MITDRIFETMLGVIAENGLNQPSIADEDGSGAGQPHAVTRDALRHIGAQRLDPADAAAIAPQTKLVDLLKR